MLRADKESFRYVMEWNALNDAYWAAHPVEFKKATTFNAADWRKKRNGVTIQSKADAQFTPEVDADESD